MTHTHKTYDNAYKAIRGGNKGIYVVLMLLYWCVMEMTVMRGYEGHEQRCVPTTVEVLLLSLSVNHSVDKEPGRHLSSKET